VNDFGAGAAGEDAGPVEKVNLIISVEGAVELVLLRGGAPTATYVLTPDIIASLHELTDPKRLEMMKQAAYRMQGAVRH